MILTRRPPAAVTQPPLSPLTAAAVRGLVNRLHVQWWTLADDDAELVDSLIRAPDEQRLTAAQAARIAALTGWTMQEIAQA